MESYEFLTIALVIGLTMVILIPTCWHCFTNKNDVDDLSHDIDNAMDYYIAWVECANTKEAILSILTSLNEFSINVYGKPIKSGLTKDEFDRVSLSMIKSSIVELIETLRYRNH